MTNPAIASTFHIKYDGEAIEGGRIDARVLADSLTAMSDVLERSNRIVNGRDSKIAVKVDANMRPGSFNITIMTMVDAIGELGRTPAAEGLVNIVTLIGFGAGTIIGAYNLIAFMKRRKGRGIKKIQNAENGLKDITLDDGEAISGISAEVIEIAENQSVMLAMENMTKVLNSDGIASMEFWDDEQPGNAESIAAGDLPSFKAPNSGVLLEHDDDRILIISTASLAGNPPGWRFKNDTEDQNDFQADILDPSFLDRIKNREIVLKNGDMVKVRLRTQQSRPRRNLKTDYSVLRVLEFIPFEPEGE